MKAIIIGATGATGKVLIQLVLEDKCFNEVLTFNRKPLGIQHPKLSEHVVEFADSNAWKHEITGDVLFSCLGTTRKQAGSKEAQREVDYQYQLDVAKAAAQNAVSQYILVSSLGADPDSNFFYARIKGELEQEIERLDFQKIIIFQPGLLDRQTSDRWTENLSLAIINLLNKLGFLRKYAPLPIQTLAQAMVLSAKNKTSNRLTKIQLDAISKYVETQTI